MRATWSVAVTAALVASVSTSLAATTLFLTESGAFDYVFRIESDGTSPATIQPGVPGDPSVDPRGVAIDNSTDQAYFIRSLSLQRRSTDGTGALEDIASDIGGSNLDVEIHDGRVYWTRVGTTPATTGIFSRSLDLSDSATSVLTQSDLNAIAGLDPDIRLTSVTHIEIANGLIYWQNGSSINSASLLGGGASNVFTLSSNLLSHFDIDEPTDKIYFTDGQTKILRADLAATMSGDASGLETVRDFGFGFPGAITLDTSTDTIYYAHRNRLWSLDYNGLSSPFEIYNPGTSTFAVTDLEVLPAVPEPENLTVLGAFLTVALLFAKNRLLPTDSR